jgi:protein-tyrosine phosphatase
MRRLAQDAGLNLVIDSAGTAAYHEGEKADQRSRAAARARGYELTSIARQFQAEDFERFDYVLAMDTRNLESLQNLRQPGQDHACHLGLLRDFDPSAGSQASVPDPYYGGDGGFEEVLDQCERACRGLLFAMKRREES